MSRWLAGATALGLAALLAGFALPPSDARGAGFSGTQRRLLETSGRVGATVLDALETRDRVRVMIVFQVPGMQGRAGGGEFTTAPARSAIRRVADSLLSSLSPDEFELRHRFETVNAVAGSIAVRGLMKLLENGGLLRVDLDEGGRGGLAEALPLIGQDRVHALGYTGAGVTVAVIDTGFDSNHPSLAGALVGERCFCLDLGSGCCPDGSASQSGAGSAEDDHGHGTNVTGIITSNGSVAPLGVAPDTNIVAVKVLDASNRFCCTSDVVAALDWISVDRPDVDVVNMSLGTDALFATICDDERSYTMALAVAIDNLRSLGVPVFVSSLNNGSPVAMSAPACIGSAISVGAVWDSDVGSQFVFGCLDNTVPDLVTCFTNSNQHLELVAPGAPMTSAGIGGGTSIFSGTSQASPVAAGCAATLLQVDPTLTPDQIQNALESSPTIVSDPKNGLAFPRVDCDDAIRQVPEPTRDRLLAAALAMIALLAWHARRRPSAAPD